MEHFTVVPQGVLVREAWLEEGHLSGKQETREELAERPDKRQRAYIADIPETLLIQSGGAAGGVWYPDEVKEWRQNWNVRSKSVSCTSFNI